MIYQFFQFFNRDHRAITPRAGENFADLQYRNFLEKKRISEADTFWML